MIMFQGSLTALHVSFGGFFFFFFFFFEYYSHNILMLYKLAKHTHSML